MWDKFIISLYQWVRSLLLIKCFCLFSYQSKIEGSTSNSLILGTLQIPARSTSHYLEECPSLCSWDWGPYFISCYQFSTFYITIHYHLFTKLLSSKEFPSNSASTSFCCIFFFLISSWIKVSDFKWSCDYLPPTWKTSGNLHVYRHIAPTVFGKFSCLAFACF